MPLPNLRRLSWRGKVYGGRSPKPKRKGWTTAFTLAGRERSGPLFQELVGSLGVSSTSISQGKHRGITSVFQQVKVQRRGLENMLFLQQFSSQREAGTSLGCGAVGYSDREVKHSMTLPRLKAPTSFIPKYMGKSQSYSCICT